MDLDFFSVHGLRLDFMYEEYKYYCVLYPFDYFFSLRIVVALVEFKTLIWFEVTDKTLVMMLPMC